MNQQKYTVLTKAEAFRRGMPGWSSRGYLPHYHAAGKMQHVTFRLADSLPLEVVEKWQEDLRILPESEAKKEKYKLVEKYLDAGHGSCWMNDPHVAVIVQDALLHFEGERYELEAWCVMPNHVHALFTPLEEWTWQSILHSWQSFTALHCNRLLEQTGQFWQREPFDRFIRDEHHFQAVVRYIENNPVKAGLCEKPEDWEWSSARVRAKI